MDDRANSIYGGVFNEEVCVQFLTMCEKHLLSAFGELFTECKSKENWQSVLAECLGQVDTFGEPYFQTEVAKFLAINADGEELFRSSFIIFLKCMYNRPGGPCMHIRLTVPPFAFFMRTFLSEASIHPFVTTGEFFEPTRSPVDKKSTAVDVLRASLRHCTKEYVIAQEAHSDAPAPVGDAPHPWESASNAPQLEAPAPSPTQLSIEEQRSTCDPPSNGSVQSDLAASEKALGDTRLVPPEFKDLDRHLAALPQVKNPDKRSRSESGARSAFQVHLSSELGKRIEK